MKPADWAVEVWNRLVEVGTEVELENDLGEIERTKTRSEAWIVCSNQPVAKVEGRAGGYLLWRLKPTGNREAAHALIFQAVQLHHERCYNVLRMLFDIMLSVLAKTRPMLELRPELMDQLDELLRDVDPHNNRVRRSILDSLTASPKVYAPFDPAGGDEPEKVKPMRKLEETDAEFRERLLAMGRTAALEAGIRNELAANEQDPWDDDTNAWEEDRPDDKA
jgi:hypothetical protein